MPPEIVTLPLRAMMQVSAGQPIHVIVEVALDRGAPDPYADLGARCAQVAAQLRDAGGTIADPQDPAIAPYVFALLTPSQVETVAASAAPIARLALNEWFSKDAPRGAPSEFNRRDLIREVIAEPLATRVRTTPGALQDVIIDLDVTRTSKASRAVAEQLLGRVQARDPAACAWRSDADATHPYIFASMTGYAILALIDLDRTPAPPERAIYRVWEDATVRACINRSIATVKADAAQIAFSATGKGIVWGVLDSGIDATHPHFAHYKNLDLSQRAPLAHRDLRAGAKDDTQALVDVNGHGTHVAGIIFGAMSRAWEQQPVAVVTARNEAGIEEKQAQDLDAIAGMAPQCTLLSLRVLDDDASGRVSTIIDGIDQVQRWNDFGRRIVVHGLNLSLATRSKRSGSPAGRARCASRSTGSSVRASSSWSPPATPATAISRPNTRAPSRKGSGCRSTIPATPSSRSPSARRTAPNRIATASRTSRRKAPPATADQNPTSSRPASGSSRARRRRAGWIRRSRRPAARPRWRSPRAPTRTKKTAGRAWPHRTCPGSLRRFSRSVRNISDGPAR